MLGVGIVERDHTGKFVAGFAEQIAGMYSPEHVEFLTAKWAMELGVELSLKGFMFEGDAVNVVSSLLSNG